MIVYTFTTLRRIADEVILRGKQFINAENFDWDTLLIFINRAMQEVLARTLPYKDWAYIDTMAVTHGMLLPREYIKPIRVLLSDSGAAPYLEARYVDAKEWYATTFWQRHQEWNKASYTKPIYTLWGFNVTLGSAATDNSRVTIYLAPNTDYSTGTAPTNCEYYTTNVSGIMEFYRMPPFLRNDNDVMPIPPEFEELLILTALSRFIAKYGALDRMAEIQKLLLAERAKITERFVEKRRTEDKELDSFVDPVPPVYNPPPTTGELPANLGGKA